MARKRNIAAKLFSGKKPDIILDILHNLMVGEFKGQIKERERLDRLQFYISRNGLGDQIDPELLNKRMRYGNIRIDRVEDEFLIPLAQMSPERRQEFLSHARFKKSGGIGVLPTIIIVLVFLAIISSLTNESNKTTQTNVPAKTPTPQSTAQNSLLTQRHPGPAFSGINSEAQKPNISFSVAPSINDNARTFAQNFTAAASSNNLAELLKFYSQPVRFFGRELGSTDLEKELSAYIKRWPYRRFVAPSDKTLVECDIKGESCSVRMVVYWQAVSAVRRQKSIGTAQRILTLQTSDGTFLIKSFDEEILDRRVLPLGEAVAGNQ